MPVSLSFVSEWRETFFSVLCCFLDLVRKMMEEAYVSVAIFCK